MWGSPRALCGTVSGSRRWWEAKRDEPWVYFFLGPSPAHPQVRPQLARSSSAMNRIPGTSVPRQERADHTKARGGGLAALAGPLAAPGRPWLGTGAPCLFN